MAFLKKKRPNVSLLLREEEDLVCIGWGNSGHATYLVVYFTIMSNTLKSLLKGGGGE